MVATISREQLQRKLEHGGNVILIETLPESEFHEAHLPGAVNLPPDHKHALSLPDKDAEIVVYCSGPECDAAEVAARELMALGYNNVRVYSGGKLDWIAAGLPTVSGVPLATPY